MRFLPLILAVVLIFGGAGIYAGLRVVNPLGLGWRSHYLSWLLLLMPAALPLWLAMDRFGAGRWLNLLLAITYLALGLVSFLFVLAILRDAFWFLLQAASALLGVSAMLPVSAVMLRTSSILVVFLAVLLSTIAVRNALSAPRLESVPVEFESLHFDLEGFKIIQLSDLHLGLFRGAAFLAQVVEKVNSASPDLVVITGDLTDGSVQKLGDTAQPLVGLKAPTIFVTGNHEYYWTPGEWIRRLRDLGLEVLQNSSLTIPHKEANILVAGVSDPAGQSFFPDQPSRIPAVPTELPETGFDLKVLLAHRTRTAYQAVTVGFDLQLSGHTHGGQFFPWNYIIHLVQPFAAGLHRYQDLWIYCSRGTGFWGPPMRLGPRAEITEIILTSALSKNLR